MPASPDLLIHHSPPQPRLGGESVQGFILAPWLSALPAQGRDVLALLPVLDVNGLGFAGLQRFDAEPSGADGWQPHAIASIFCADPFLRVRDAVQILRATGITRVTNFPTIQIVDGAAARGFDSAGLGAQREVEILGQFSAAGFDVTGFAESEDVAIALAQQGAAALVLHPGPSSDHPGSRSAAARTVARKLSTLRSETDLPVRVMCPDGFGPELDAALSLADGAVRYG